MIKRILYQGSIHTSGDLELVRAEMALEAAVRAVAFDPEDLQYHPDDVRQEAEARALQFAKKVRHQIVDEPDALRRDGWTMKGVGAMIVLLRNDATVFDQLVAPRVLQSFEQEAERRGLGESANELMLSSVTKMLEMLLATNLVEGNLRGVQKAIESTEPDQIETLLSSAMEAAEQDRQLLSQQA